MSSSQSGRGSPTTAFEREVDVLLRARSTLLVVVSPEEERALRTLTTICGNTGRSLIAWDAADGFRVLTGAAGSPGRAKDPMTALEQIDKADDQTVFVLTDFHDCWGNAQIRRKLRNLAQRLRYRQVSMVITTPGAAVPDELRDDAVVLDFPRPTARELGKVLTQLTSTPGVTVHLTPLGREKLVGAAVGLTATQAQRVFAKAIVGSGRLDDRDIDLVTREKKQILRESEALEFYAVTETPDDVGGLGVLKEWLRLRERAFTQEARDYGLPVPRGVALIGIPGTGKSLTAKMIGGLWRLPVLRLDVGALFGSLVGQSEERTRRALSLAETVAPCVVWIDEMEKALSQGGLDGGTSTRVFGSILTWMQEKTAPCFVVATANDVSRLPPELLRRGRFDEIFFLDLPTEPERTEILGVHLKKRERIPADFDLARLAAASEGYVGAELEQAIVDAMYLGFDAGREFTTDDVLTALSKQVPLSVSQREIVGHLRNWLREGRAQSASFRGRDDAERQFVRLEPPKR